MKTGEFINRVLFRVLNSVCHHSRIFPGTPPMFQSYSYWHHVHPRWIRDIFPTSYHSHISWKMHDHDQVQWAPYSHKVAPEFPMDAILCIMNQNICKFDKVYLSQFPKDRNIGFWIRLKMIKYKLVGVLGFRKTMTLFNLIYCSVDTYILQWIK